eukprot:COSAG06_NODE_1679_length_8738_cov_49.835050_4_plen_225_part_00
MLQQRQPPCGSGGSLRAACGPQRDVGSRSDGGGGEGTPATGRKTAPRSRTCRTRALCVARAARGSAAAAAAAAQPRQRPSTAPSRDAHDVGRGPIGIPNRNLLLRTTNAPRLDCLHVALMIIYALRSRASSFRARTPAHTTAARRRVFRRLGTATARGPWRQQQQQQQQRQRQQAAGAGGGGGGGGGSSRARREGGARVARRGWWWGARHVAQGCRTSLLCAMA